GTNGVGTSRSLITGASVCNPTFQFFGSFLVGSASFSLPWLDELRAASDASLVQRRYCLSRPPASTSTSPKPRAQPYPKGSLLRSGRLQATRQANDFCTPPSAHDCESLASHCRRLCTGRH